MIRATSARIALSLWALALLAIPALLGGCQRDAVMSEEEIKRVRQGPPREMPPEARAMMERMAKDPNYMGPQKGQNAAPDGAKR